MRQKRRGLTLISDRSSLPYPTQKIKHYFIFFTDFFQPRKFATQDPVYSPMRGSPKENKA